MLMTIIINVFKIMVGLCAVAWIETKIHDKYQVYGLLLRIINDVIIMHARVTSMNAYQFGIIDEDRYDEVLDVLKAEWDKVHRLPWEEA